MSNHQEDNKQPSAHYEHGVPVLDVQSETQREKAEADAREKQYKDDQVTLNKRLVRATVALVVATILLAIISGIQLWYIHRQWKLTSNGLSKMGDQIWAAKEAAYAAASAANTAKSTLESSQRQFHIEERPYVVAVDITPMGELTDTGEIEFLLRFTNAGKTPAIKLVIGNDAFLNGMRVARTPSEGSSESVIAPGKDTTMSGRARFNTSTVKAIREKTVELTIRGTARYSDIFRDWHTTKFCGTYQPRQNKFTFCPSGNDAE